MLWTPLIVACLCLSIIGCRGRIQPMPCENVLKLRMGQSRAEVRALLGKPHFEVEQRSGPDEPDGSVFWYADYIFFYGAHLSGQTVILGFRDEMDVEFLNDRLVKARAYRMFQYGPEHDRGATGFRIFTEWSGAPPTYRLGEEFNSMFNCPSTPALEEARKQFLAAFTPPLAPAVPR